MTTEFIVDTKDAGSAFPHYWEQCVGSCHAIMGTRADWRAQLEKCHRELGFQYVRFHGLLNDEMSVCKKDPTGSLHYSFFNIDSIFDFLLEIGMKPFIELGFMPDALASGTATCFHYKANITPPADYEQWEALIKALTQHLVDRYGCAEVRSWFFEVWNEPNLKFFWAGSREEYFKLYEHSARAIKSVDSQLRVGGPATSVNAWIPDMLEFCRRTGIPLDFVSTHHYPTDDPLWKNSNLSMEEFFQQFAHEMGKYERGILRKMTDGPGPKPEICRSITPNGIPPRCCRTPSTMTPTPPRWLQKPSPTMTGWWMAIPSGLFRIYLKKADSFPSHSMEALACKRYMESQNPPIGSLRCCTNWVIKE